MSKFYISEPWFYHLKMDAIMPTIRAFFRRTKLENEYSDKHKIGLQNMVFFAASVVVNISVQRVTPNHTLRIPVPEENIRMMVKL